MRGRVAAFRYAKVRDTGYCPPVHEFLSRGTGRAPIIEVRYMYRSRRMETVLLKTRYWPLR